MTTLFLVGLGGFLGAAGRYLVGQGMMDSSLEARFPVATLIVNVVGCALIGLIAGLAARQGGPGQLAENLTPAWLNANAEAFIMTGVLGGFTTFSAFGNETFQLLRRGDTLAALGYVGATVVLGLLAVWLGYRLAET